MSRIVTSSGSTHMGSTTTPDLRDSPTMNWVVILMSLSAGRWHRGGMTLVGGRAVVGTRSSHVPIVIGASPEFRRPVWVHGVVYGAVNPLLQVAARAARLVVGAAPSTGRPA
jgi:hypothetical protein